ncbi:LysR family transcriptional regulator [Rhodobacteraceae bacterium B1Z28]|uniref:LysR family transcriptional regulator n=1 Tax=Ruegeria haliotis TaxID=2747601 RepID=A0ABX2PXE1_9RHOB|nr:LysR substrate-binding domain-containing protein [Ruegeria haliotis]NVO58295.1 LysR family transcriptional regulator [Ruegeria haliotis]
MMNLPHLTFLRSFEAAARHLNFTSAAVELNCTQSAVSNHVRSLEEFIGRPLFVRHARSLSLTDVGEAYLPSVRHALQEIDVATQSVIQHSHARKVVVSCPISLSENWLPDVIREFNAVHPDIDLTVHGTVWTDVEPNVSDISLTINHVDDVTADMKRLWVEKLAVVCAPGFLVDGAPLTDPRQLQDAPLIHILGRPAYWERVALHFGLTNLNQKEGLRTNASNLAMEMAAKSLGCVALPRSLANSYVQRGLLIEPFKFDLESPWTYFVQLKDKPITPPVRLFQDWLFKAAANMSA